MSQAKAEFQKFRTEVLQKLEVLSSEHSQFVAERIKLHLEWYELLIHRANTEEKRQSLLKDLTSTNIFAAMTTNLPLYWYDKVYRSSTDINMWEQS
jgi:hypothetical protein